MTRIVTDLHRNWTPPVTVLEYLVGHSLSRPSSAGVLEQTSKVVRR